MKTISRRFSILILIAWSALLISSAAWADGSALEPFHELRAQLAESLPLIGVDRVHRELGITGSGIGVLVIDDWTEKEGFAHGQAVADVVEATAPGASIWLCKLDFSQTTAEEITSCLREAVRRDQTIRVVNLSFAVGDRAFSRPCGFIEDPLAQTIRELSRRGMIFVAASGNDGLRGALRFPACLPEVISVGATYDLSGPVEFEGERVHCRDLAAVDRVTCYSNVAPYLDLVAPGTIISTPSAQNFGGTSAATPIVSGVIALLLEAAPDLDEQAVVKTLQATATPAFDPASARFYPRVDAYRALLEVLSAQPSLPPASAEIARYDTNHNGRIDDPELLIAIDQWISYQISDELFFAVLDAWVNQRPIRAERSTGPKTGRLPLERAAWVEFFDLSGRPIAQLREPSIAQLDMLFGTLANGVYLYSAVFYEGGREIHRRGKLLILR